MMINKIMSYNRNPKGQVLVIVVILVFGIAAMLMLILDGGFDYMYRRQAQNAADAGALAGVVEICGGNPDYVAAKAAATDYVERNGAIIHPDFIDDASFFPTSESITVTTQITFKTSFGKLFDLDEIQVRADASAECGNVVTADGVIPSAFPCDPNPPEGEEGYSDLSDSVDCKVKFGDPEAQIGDYVEDDEDLWDEMVIMVDSSDDTLYCQPAGPIDCDINGDGIPDIISADSKGWLNLNGGVIDTTELVNWIINGYDDVQISPNTWVGHRPGVNEDIYNAIYTREGDTVMVPIIDAFCPGITQDGPPVDCGSAVIPPALPLWQDGDSWIPSEGIHPYYRIVGWGLFHIVCTYSDGPRDKENPERCPFRNSLIGVLGDNLQVKTVEGYFVAGAQQGGTGNTGVDFGVYWYWLTE